MTEPYQIQPDAIFDDAALWQALRLSPEALARARRNGELRFTKKGARTLYLGQWVLDWLIQEAIAQ